jgi:hypothetical protein
MPAYAFPAGLNLPRLKRNWHNQKKSKMKQQPTISMKTKGRFWEPTMLMIARDLLVLTHDVKQKKGSCRTRAGRARRVNAG